MTRRGSEYDPILAAEVDEDDEPDGGSDLARVRERFAAAARPYLRYPWSWLAWAVVLPLAARLHGPFVERRGAPGALLLWSVAILLGGLVEGGALLRARRQRPSSLVTWMLRVQGNLSLAAVVLSAALLFFGLGAAVPGLWLLLVGHSFYVVGGLAFPPFRTYGIGLQVGGVAALWPGLPPLEVFAVVAAVANGWLAWKVFLHSRQATS